MDSVELYNIELNLDTEKKTFRGMEKIIGIANGSIALDSFGLSITSLKVNGKDCQFSIDNEKQELTVNGNFSGKIELDIVFNGKVSDSLNRLSVIISSTNIVVTCTNIHQIC